MERTKEHSKEYSSYEERAKDGDERVKHPRDIDTRTRHSEAFHTLAERLRLKKETRKAHDSALLQQKDEKDKKFQSIIQENQQPNEKESAEEKTSTVKDAENVAKKHEDLAKNVTDESENKKENFVITAFGSRIIQSDNKLIRRKVESKKEQIPKNDDIDPFGIFGERKLDDILKRTKNKNSCQKTQKPLVKTISNGPENILGVRKGILKRTKSYEKTVKSTEEESSKIISTDDSSEPKHSTNNVSNSPEKLATVSKDAPSNLTGSCEDAKYLPKTIVKKSENQSYISDEKEKIQEIMEGSFEDSMPPLDELDFVNKNEDSSNSGDDKKVKKPEQDTVVQEISEKEVPNLNKLRADEVSKKEEKICSDVLPEIIEKFTPEDVFLSTEDEQSSLLNNEYLNTDIVSFDELLQPLPPVDVNSQNFASHESTSTQKSPQRTNSSTSIETNEPTTRSTFPKLSFDENKSAPPSPISFSFGSVLVSSPSQQQSDNSTSDNESSVAENIVESDTVVQKTKLEAQECNSEDDESSEKNESEESSLKKEDLFCRKPKTQKVESSKTKIKQEKTSKNKTNENEFAAAWKAQNPKTSKRNLKKNTPKKSEKIKIPRKREKKSTEVEEVYEVEKILRKRLNKKGCTEYEVKWVGFPSSSNTWEAIENLDKCPEVLKEFEMQASKKQAKTHSRPRKKSESTPAALKLPPKKK